MCISYFVVLISYSSTTGGGNTEAAPIWPMFQKDEGHTALCPHSTASNPGMVKWKFKVGDTILSTPVIGADGTIYIGSKDKHLYAIDKNGTLKWKFNAKHELHTSPAIGSDDTIYVGTKDPLRIEDNFLYAINLDGTEKWNLKIDGRFYSSITIGSEDTLYFGVDDHSLYAVDRNGSIRWKFQTGDIVYSTPAIGKDCTVYVGSDDKYFYAINPDGTKKWSFKSNISVVSSPMIDSYGIIYIPSAGSLRAITPNGTEKWRFSYLGGASPAVCGVGGSIYLGTTIFADNYDAKEGYVYAITPNGTEKWRFKTIGGVESLASSSDGSIYISSNYVENLGGLSPGVYKYGQIYTIDSNGTEKWKRKTEYPITSPFAISFDGTIYVCSGPCLYAIGNGTDDWYKEPKKGFFIPDSGGAFSLIAICSVALILSRRRNRC